MNLMIDFLYEKFKDEKVDYVAGIESRGFIFGAPLACRLNAGFIPIRKPNKLPADTIKESYSLEYGTDTILIGVPYNMDGSLGFQAKNCLKFIEPLRKKYVILEQDERLSSQTAEDILKQKGKKYTKNKGLVDVASACVILEEYLESNR
jgi:putative transcription antitermination factor YqgF